MQNDSALQKRIQNLSDEELAKMINEASAYRPEAISYAQEELSRRGGLDAVSTRISISRQHEEDKRREEYGTKPLFLHIPIGRLIFMSIMSFGLYEMYWIYRNWKYIKERDDLDIRPFARGWFGIFWCHSLLRRIHEDKEARAVQSPSFSPGGLATGWVVLLIVSIAIARAPIAASIISAFVPSFLCLVPVQNYINSVSEKRNPGKPYYGWSSGHIVCLVWGVIIWALSLIGLGVE
ncbi:MAG: hypothetical protein ACE5HI_20200 [bacterium]